VIAKMNALQDPKIITTLYEASQAGVQIDLLVRGFCSLRAQVPGLSDNVRVVSVLGRSSSTAGSSTS
jgi:polyphosphate kinase